MSHQEYCRYYERLQEEAAKEAQAAIRHIIRDLRDRCLRASLLKLTLPKTFNKLTSDETLHVFVDTLDVIEREAQERDLARLMRQVIWMEPPDVTVEGELHDPYITRQQAATLLRVSTRTIRRWIIEGMPCFQRDKVIRLKESQIRGWLRYRRTDLEAIKEKAIHDTTRPVPNNSGAPVREPDNVRNAPTLRVVRARVD